MLMNKQKLNYNYKHYCSIVFGTYVQAKQHNYITQDDNAGDTAADNGNGSENADENDSNQEEADGPVANNDNKTIMPTLNNQI